MSGERAEGGLPQADDRGLAVGGGLEVRAVGQGSVAAGRIDRVTVQAAPYRAASLPHQVGVIPPRAHAFQDRVQAGRLRAAVAAGGTAVLCQVPTGMGGVGKTQLAADYARTAWAGGEVDLLVWVTAVDRAAVVAGLGRAGVAVAGADPADPQAAAEAFVAWLEPKAGQRPCRWLVVLDDVAHPADLRGLWPPPSPHGRTLVTTRRRDAALAGPGRRRIDVGE